MAHDVFITHSSKDRQIAQTICAALEEGGIKCWYAPRNIPGGASWTGSIIDGLNTSRLMVLVWSANSNASSHVAREVHHAFKRNITVIPFQIEDVPATKDLEYYLESVQWLEAYTSPLEENLPRLIQHVSSILHQMEAEAARQRAEEEERLRREDAEQEAAREQERRRLEAEAASQRAEEQERHRLEAEAARRQAEEEERRQREAAEKEAKEQERRRLETEAARRQAEEEERRQREAAEKEAEEQERRRLEAEAARRQAEEEERRRREAAEKEAEEQERRQLEAEAARRQAEEEERQRREAAEKEAEEQERRQLEAEAARRQAEEEERQRREALERANRYPRRSFDGKRGDLSLDIQPIQEKGALSVVGKRTELAITQPEVQRSSLSLVKAYLPTLEGRSVFWLVVVAGLAVVITILLVLYSSTREPPPDLLAATSTPAPAPLSEPTSATQTADDPKGIARPQTSAKPTPSARASLSPNRLQSSEPAITVQDTPPPQIPTPTPAPAPTPHAPLSGGVINGKAVNLVTPPYPPIARSAHASGSVQVQVLIDENGNVISAHAVSGHPLLQAAATSAAMASKFTPTKVLGEPVKVRGIIIYNFVAQ